MISFKNQISNENAKQDRYLLFSVSSNLYAVGLPYIFRIIAIDQIHPMGVLLEYRENKTCILIDDVRSVFTVDPEEMIPPLGKNNYVSGSMQIENRIISFLSIDSLFG